jgi:hypothetical protein
MERLLKNFVRYLEALQNIFIIKITFPKCQIDTLALRHGSHTIIAGLFSRRSLHFPGEDGQPLTGADHFYSRAYY